jgi:hypothetical protein
VFADTLQWSVTVSIANIFFEVVRLTENGRTSFSASDFGELINSTARGDPLSPLRVYNMS